MSGGRYNAIFDGSYHPTHAEENSDGTNKTTINRMGATINTTSGSTVAGVGARAPTAARSQHGHWQPIRRQQWAEATKPNTQKGDGMAACCLGALENKRQGRRWW